MKILDNLRYGFSILCLSVAMTVNSAGRMGFSPLWYYIDKMIIKMCLLLPSCQRIVDNFFNCDNSGRLRYLCISRIDGLLCRAQSANLVIDIA